MLSFEDERDSELNLESSVASEEFAGQMKTDVWKCILNTELTYNHQATCTFENV